MIHIAYSTKFVLPLPQGHRFPMEKYSLLIGQLLHEGLITQENLTDPGLIPEELILTTHQKSYWESLKSLTVSPKMVRRIGFPLTQTLIERSMSSSMGTLFAAQKALENGIAFNSAGGTHHAYRDKGEGFCLLNDLAIAANYLLNHQLAKKILIVDLDVHQGNGTAVIFQDDHRVFTWSAHCEANYPLQKEKSDLDTAFGVGTNDEDYLEVIETTLIKLIEVQEPDFIFFQAGVDVLASDQLGHLSLSREGCKQRDRIVLQTAYEYEIPIAVSMGGGYSSKIIDIVEAHCNTYRMAFSIFDT